MRSDKVYAQPTIKPLLQCHLGYVQENTQNSNILLKNSIDVDINIPVRTVSNIIESGKVRSPQMETPLGGVSTKFVNISN